MTPFFRGWVLGTGLGGTLATIVGAFLLGPRLGWATWVWIGLAFAYGSAVAIGWRLWQTMPKPEPTVREWLNQPMSSSEEAYRELTKYVPPCSGAVEETLKGWVCHPVSTKKYEGTLTVWPEDTGQWYALRLERGFAPEDESDDSPLPPP